jgi:hypothetical protein
MIRAFLKPASSQGPYDGEGTVTQGLGVYNVSADLGVNKLPDVRKCISPTRLTNHIQYGAERWPSGNSLPTRREHRDITP